jgi:P27 family predicted phage terminase small subunit
MSGPRPKPSGLRLIEGTDKRGRAGKKLDLSKEPVAPDGELVCPYELNDEKQEIWDRTVRDLETMGVASPADANQVAAYVEAVHLHRRASIALADQGLLVQGDKVRVMNKLIQIQRESAATMLRFAQEFGLTPSARTRVEVGSYGSKQPSAQSAAKKPNPFAGSN